MRLHLLILRHPPLPFCILLVLSLPLMHHQLRHFPYQGTPRATISHQLHRHLASPLDRRSVVDDSPSFRVDNSRSQGEDSCADSELPPSRLQGSLRPRVRDCEYDWSVRMIGTTVGSLWTRMRFDPIPPMRHSNRRLDMYTITWCGIKL